MIAFGASDMTKAYLGGTEVSKMYLGDELVFGGSSPTPVLPYDAQVEYLHTDGNCWIYTDIYLYNHTIIAEFQQLSYINNNCLFGAIESSNGAKWVHLTYYSNKLYYGVGETQERNVSIPQGFNTNWHEYSIDTRGIFKIDGNTMVSISNVPRLFSSRKLVVFGRSTASAGAIQTNSLSGNTSCRKFQVVNNNNGEIIIDLIPVRVGQVGYMYDKISGTLFGNSGTGSFTYGNDVTT